MLCSALRNVCHSTTGKCSAENKVHANLRNVGKIASSKQFPAKIKTISFILLNGNQSVKCVVLPEETFQKHTIQLSPILQKYLNMY